MDLNIDHKEMLCITVWDSALVGHISFPLHLYNSYSWKPVFKYSKQRKKTVGVRYVFMNVEWIKFVIH
jgi:hypothetical protein